MTSTSCPGPCASVCRCHDVVFLAVTASNGAFYVGWICARCLADDAEEGLLDVLSVYASLERAEWDLLMEEYHASSRPTSTWTPSVPFRAASDLNPWIGPD